MELCNLNLDDYIYGGLKHFYGTKKFYDSESIDNPLGCLSFLGIVEHIASGLAFIHSKGELHRDLKPRNGIPNSLNADISPPQCTHGNLEDHRFRTYL